MGNATTYTGRKQGQGSKWIRKDKRLAIYLRDGMCCAYCGVGVEELDAPLTLDHLLACELGGTNEHTNLVTCCGKCNSQKQDLSMRGWFAKLRNERDVDTTKMGARIRRLVKKDLKPYRAQAKAIIASRSN